jgi:hypothetical protein
MADMDFDIRLKKEAKTQLALFRDQSLLRRKFGDDAVELYNLIDSGKTAMQLMAELGMEEEKFVEIIEFLNNNAMVSIVPSEPQAPSSQGEGAPQDPQDEGRAPMEQIEEDAPSEPDAAPEQEEAARPSIYLQPGRQAKAFDENSLSPLEKVLYKKHGEIGVRIYNLIDGEKTAEEILHETGVSEAKLVEVLEFMDEQGIIKLEKPEEKAAPAAEPESPPGDEPGGSGGENAEEGADGDDKPVREPRFKPFVEDVPEGNPYEPPKTPPAKTEEEKKKEAEVEEPGEDIVMVDVPAMAKISMVQKAMMFAELSTKFPPAARHLFDLSDGKHDFVELSLSTGMSLFDIDAAMAYFGKKGFITFRQLDRNEIRERYGEDGFAIYKRFGREGLLIYEMIGKEASLRDIILKSKMDPDRAIDIFAFIHKVLGLDIPLDRDLIYRQIGMKK